MWKERLSKLESRLDEVGEVNARSLAHNSEEMGREYGLQEAFDIMMGDD